MPRARTHLLTILGLTALAGRLVVRADDPPPGPDPASMAAIIPVDASLFLQIEGAAELRRQASSRPLRAVLDRLLDDGAIGEAWRALAARARLDEGQLFDGLLGTHCALALRGSDPEAERQWVVVTEIAPLKRDTVMAPLQPKRHAPRFGIPVAELPEHALLIAALGPTTVIGPVSGDGLFDDTLALLAGERRAALAEAPASRRARELAASMERPRVALLARHAPPLGGWSALVADVGPQVVRLRHAGDFDASPFTRPVPTRPWTPGSLPALEADGLATMVEPTEIGLPVQDFIEAMLAQPLLDREARRCIGARQMLFVGEVEGRMEAPAVDMIVPTFAVALEISPDADPGALVHLHVELESVIDRNAIRLGQSIERLGEGTFDLAMPRTRDFAPHAPRAIDLEPAAAWLAPGLPILRGTSLNWTTVDGPHGRFWVVATHPSQLRASVAALSRPADPEPIAERNWSSCGSLAGGRAATHLRSWAANAAVIAPDAPPETMAGFRATLELIAAACEPVDRCRWMLARPTARSMELEVVLDVSERSGG